MPFLATAERAISYRALSPQTMRSSWWLLGDHKKFIATIPTLLHHVQWLSKFPTNHKRQHCDGDSQDNFGLPMLRLPLWLGKSKDKDWYGVPSVNQHILPTSVSQVDVLLSRRVFHLRHSIELPSPCLPCLFAWQNAEFHKDTLVWMN